MNKNYFSLSLVSVALSVIFFLNTSLPVETTTAVSLNAELSKPRLIETIAQMWNRFQEKQREEYLLQLDFDEGQSLFLKEIRETVQVVEEEYQEQLKREYLEALERERQRRLERERQERVARQAHVAGLGRCGGSLPPCYVMMRESGGNIVAQNPTSTASGKWQFLDSTWGGYQGYAKARHAPEHIQDQRARELWANGAGCSHWSAC